MTKVAYLREGNAIQVAPGVQEHALARLDLAAGSYVVIAKVTVASPNLSLWLKVANFRPRDPEGGVLGRQVPVVADYAEDTATIGEFGPPAGDPNVPTGSEGMAETEVGALTVMVCDSIELNGRAELSCTSVDGAILTSIAMVVIQVDELAVFTTFPAAAFGA